MISKTWKCYNLKLRHQNHGDFVPDECAPFSFLKLTASNKSDETLELRFRKAAIFNLIPRLFPDLKNAGICDCALVGLYVKGARVAGKT